MLRVTPGNVAMGTCARTSYVIFSNCLFQSITKTLQFISVTSSRNGVGIKDFIALFRVFFITPRKTFCKVSSELIDSQNIQKNVQSATVLAWHLECYMFSNVVQKDAVPLHYKNPSGCPIPSSNSDFTICFTCVLLTLTRQTWWNIIIPLQKKVNEK